jgi:hypothetical protein
MLNAASVAAPDTGKNARAALPTREFLESVPQGARSAKRPMR